MGFIKNVKELINTNNDVTYLSKSVEVLTEEKGTLETSIKQLKLEKKLAQQETKITTKKLERNRAEYRDLLERISSQMTLEELQEEVNQLAGTIELYTSIEEAKKVLSELRNEITELTTVKQDITYLKENNERTKNLYILLYRSFQEEDQTIYTAPFRLWYSDSYDNYCHFYHIFNIDQEIYTNYKMTARFDSNGVLKRKSSMEFVKGYSLSEADYLNGTQCATQKYITLYDLNELCKAVRRHEGLDDKQLEKPLTKTK